MFATSFQYFPTGYRTPLMQGFKAETQVDEQWVTLYKKMRNGEISGDSVEFQKQVIKHTRRLFGNLLDWLDAQDQNVRLPNNGYEFLKDTIEFLNKGRRRISADCRMGLIATDFSNQDQNNPKAENRQERLRDLLDIKSEEYIFVWLNHKGGFADMLCTVNLLFGTDPHVRS